jgi:hypothetical protein
MKRWRDCDDQKADSFLAQAPAICNWLRYHAGADCALTMVVPNG